MAQITLGGNPCNTNGELPVQGTQIGNYSFAKGDLSQVSLHEFRGKKVILNIFPSIDTSVCATSVRTFNKKAASLENTQVLCISRDLPFAQSRFCGAEGIDKVMTVSDFRNPGFAEDMGIRIVDGPFAGLDARSVIVLNEEGNVIHAELVGEIANEPDYDKAIAVTANV